MSNRSVVICLLPVNKAANPVRFSGLSKSCVSWRWPEGMQALGTTLLIFLTVHHIEFRKPGLFLAANLFSEVHVPQNEERLSMRVFISS